MKSSTERRRHLHRLREAQAFVTHASFSCNLADKDEKEVFSDLMDAEKLIIVAMSKLSAIDKDENEKRRK